MRRDRHCGIADRREPFGRRQRVEVAERRRAVPRCAVEQPEQDADATRRGLRPHHRPLLVLLFRQLDDLRVQIRTSVGLHQPVTHGPARPATDLTHHGDLSASVRERLVVTLTEAHGSFEHPSPRALKHVAKGQQLVGSRPRARDGAAIRDDVAEGPAGGDPEGAGPQRLLGHLAHAGDLIGRTGALHHRALTHRRDAQRAVADEPTDVDALGRAIEPAEVVPVRRPVPRKALQDRPTGDVLHALHHLGEELALTRADRRERHPAVPQHHARDAVPAR